MPPILPCCKLWAGSNKFTSIFFLLKGNLKDVNLSDALLWDYFINLALTGDLQWSNQSMLPHSSRDFIANVDQFFSIIITFKSMSFSVFAVAWPNETVLQSKLCGPLLFSSGFLLWTGHKSISLPLPSFLVGNDLLNSLVKHPSVIPPRQSGAFHLWLWASQFLFLCEPQHYIVAFWTQTQGSLCYSCQLWIHSFIVYSYCLEQSVLPGWVLHSKSVVCVFIAILKFKSIKVFNSVIPKLLQSAQEILPQIHKVL